MLQDFKYILLIALILVAGSLALTYGQSKDTSLSGSTAQRDFPPPPPDGFRRGPGPDPLERINLTDEQREQIGLIRLTARDVSREQESKVRAADEQIRMYVESGVFDIEKVRPLVKAKFDAQVSIELSRLAADAEINKDSNLRTKDAACSVESPAAADPSGQRIGTSSRQVMVFETTNEVGRTPSFVVENYHTSLNAGRGPDGYFNSFFIPFPVLVFPVRVQTQSPCLRAVDLLGEAEI